MLGLSSLTAVTCPPTMSRARPAASASTTSGSSENSPAAAQHDLGAHAFLDLAPLLAGQLAEARRGAPRDDAQAAHLVGACSLRLGSPTSRKPRGPPVIPGSGTQAKRSSPSSSVASGSPSAVRGRSLQASGMP